jgi:hypothetical protein
MNGELVLVPYSEAKLLLRAELDQAQAAIDAEEALHRELARMRSGEVVGHWGPDSERFEELVATCTAHRAFPPNRWWPRTLP